MSHTPSATLPPNASVFTRVRLGLTALNKAKDDPGNPDHARLLHMSFDEDTYANLAKVLRETPEGCQLLDERKTIPGEGIDLEWLSSLPEGTLGHQFARYFIDNGIEPFSFEYPLRNDADFLNKRYRETHDIHHIVTGYGIDEIGEVELQAFYYSNLGLRHAGLIAMVSVPYVLAKSGLRNAWKLIGRLRAAYRRGKDSRDLLSVNFDEMWEQPVAEISKLICAPAASFE